MSNLSKQDKDLIEMITSFRNIDHSKQKLICELSNSILGNKYIQLDEKHLLDVFNEYVQQDN
ncbi:TPA: hypothetical protein LR821_000587 [Clostridioides difficile]|uniref:hypothetical protein n=1 Tax=Clostridioides TaxID=1870884 RepID=UPI00038DBBD8|nr:hypothetical protein [Clostridioides difficile]MCC0738431.1 hypothetical protein [Clostridioides sp. ZZV14-5902]AUA29350.1 hypothetical protein CWR54_09895 [Clostridioides difficile]EQH45475.1 hypothetical protein QME_3833 [Clostridioides difficile DA00246]MBG0171706.1 hypothetical protein [Clostridioides difficile]MBZ0651203.1 hypothetical protein [Clostridioides difficile]